MAYVSELIAKKLKLDDNDILTLNYAAKLAGVGKVFVPQALLTKPGKLTDDELEIIQTHVVSAKLVLEQIDFSLPIVQTIENMYERLDGSGYPMGKKAEEIGQPSRILAIADAFCALIVPRSYRDGIDFNDAIKLLQQQSGEYDAAILIILQEIIAKMPDVRKEFIINLK
jgi:HD-GYP domain-containing protein (c-di-GMP phosphodiesterase class II)